MATKQDINAPLIVTIGAISGILVLVLVIGVQAWYLFLQDQDAKAKLKDEGTEPLQSMVIEQNMRLNTATPAQGDTPAHIPIDQAIALLVKYQGRVPGTPAATQPVAAQAAVAQ